MTETKIQWTDAVWNPVRGCSRVSEGCRYCYAERQAARFSDPGQYAHGFVERRPEGPRWTGRVEIVESKLGDPLRWRKPRRVFVNSMSDLFHESLPDEAIDRVFAVMALCPQHTFQVLTKRPERMREYLAGASPRAAIAASDMIRGDPFWRWPLPNAWLGVSVEDQATADERIPVLLNTPAAVRFVSAEPLLGRLDLYRASPVLGARQLGVDWVIAGGESGPGARSCDVAWIRSIVEQCRGAAVPVFVKQLGYAAVGEGVRGAAYSLCDWRLRDRKGGDTSEWPMDLRVREFHTER